MRITWSEAATKAKDVWAIRIHLQNAHPIRDLALFNLAIESKLRGCALVNLHVRDVTHGNQILSRAMKMQSANQAARAVRGHGARARQSSLKSKKQKRGPTNIFFLVAFLGRRIS
jgi:hypothetical protein